MPDRKPAVKSTAKVEVDRRANGGRLDLADLAALIGEAERRGIPSDTPLSGGVRDSGVLARLSVEAEAPPAAAP